MKLGIDFGSSYTDFVLMKDKNIVKSLSVKSDKLDLSRALKKFPLDKIDEIKVTGAGSRKLKKLKVKRVDEIKAIGLGGKFVSKKRKVLVVSIGSGTCVVSVDKSIRHVGGTPVGGRTLQGLSKLLLKTDQCDRIFDLAKKGDLSKVDLMMKDFYPKGVGLLDSKGSISHFGKIKNPKKSDLALGIVNMVGQTIGTVAALAAKTNNHRYIVLTGKLPQSKLVQDVIKKRILKFHKAKIIVSKNAGVATAIGTIVD